ncbi:sensor histidine kinase [Streptomyces sp. NPDC059443]|uniref:sensor histidine kinase n=1 Tax=unclassified Streptomyces TaxID=2593676 RepID=UPI0036B00A14
MNSSTATIVGRGFSEALHEGLLRAAPRMNRPRTSATSASSSTTATAVATPAHRGPAVPGGRRRAAASGSVLWAWETEAILERFAAHLPSVLPPAEADLPELHTALTSSARTILLRAADPARPQDAEAAPLAASPRQLVTAASLLFECAMLHVLEHGTARDATVLLRAVAVVQSLTEAMHGAGDHFWQGDGGWSDNRRLARQLHDELGGALTAARRSITLAARDPKAAPAHLNDAGRALDEAGRENRALVDGLRRRSRMPSLREALDGFVAGARPAALVTVRVTGDETVLPERSRQELFLVLREALRNCFAHAAADSVDVTVRTTRRWLYAKVEDNGTGPAAQAGTGTAGPGYGLCSMAERVEELGGRLRVSPGEENGTLVEIHLPLTGNRAA